MQTKFAGGNTTLRNWKPKQYLGHAERHANSIRKLLAGLRDRDGCSNPASKADAEGLALLIEQLAQRGQRQSAAAAAVTVDQVERLTRLLAAKLSELQSAGR